jgi:hypothetical protein
LYNCIYQISGQRAVRLSGEYYDWSGITLTFAKVIYHHAPTGVTVTISDGIEGRTNGVVCSAYAGNVMVASVEAVAISK